MEVSLCISSQPPDMTENCPLGCIPGSGFRVWGESTNTSSLRPMGLLFWLWEEDWKKEDMRGGDTVLPWGCDLNGRFLQGAVCVSGLLECPPVPLPQNRLEAVTRKIKEVSGGSPEMDKAGWRSWQERHCTQHVTVLGQSQVWIRVREEEYILTQGGKSKCQVTQTAAGSNPNIFFNKEKKNYIL